MEFLGFVARFKRYSPYNASLIYVQKPGARIVASPRRWLRDFDRRVRHDARPIAILQPGSPILFLFDVSDTEPVNEARPRRLPDAAVNPFQAKGQLGEQLEKTIRNAKRDGVETILMDHGSLRGGSIQGEALGRFVQFDVKAKPEPEYVRLPIRYVLKLSASHDRPTRYTSLAHELGHLYCGHLGSPDPRWWPDRFGKLDKSVREFEAEAVSHLVCTRLGVESPSAAYLAGYFHDNDEAPEISIETVLRAAGIIEAMSERRLGLRKPSAGR